MPHCCKYAYTVFDPMVYSNVLQKTTRLCDGVKTSGDRMVKVFQYKIRFEELMETKPEVYCRAGHFMEVSFALCCGRGPQTFGSLIVLRKYQSNRCNVYIKNIFWHKSQRSQNWMGETVQAHEKNRAVKNC